MSVTGDGLVVVIPAFNEVRTVRSVVRRARQFADHVVVVDDGSTDGTAGQLTGLGVPVIRHARNQGKAAAMREGFSWGMSRGRAIITLDADGQHHPEEIPSFVHSFHREPLAIVIGTRVLERSTIPWVRRVAHATARFWISLAAGVPIRDTQSGFRLYPVAVLERLQGRCDWGSGFALESEILIEAGRHHFPIVEVPISAVYDVRLRPSHYRPIRDTWAIIRMVSRKLLRPRMHPRPANGADAAVIEDTHASEFHEPSIS